MRRSSGSSSSRGSSVSPRRTVSATDVYSASGVNPRHGQHATPSCAGAHGASTTIALVRPVRTVQRRSGAAVSIASRTVCAARVDANGPR